MMRKRGQKPGSAIQKKRSSNSHVDDNGEDVDIDDDDSDGERRPTPCSALSSMRPPGRKRQKKKLKKA